MSSYIMCSNDTLVDTSLVTSFMLIKVFSVLRMLSKLGGGGQQACYIKEEGATGFTTSCGISTGTV